MNETVETNGILELLRFELKFLEDGGYGRSPHAPQRPSLVFEDSPSCLNFDDPARPHPCSECMLLRFVPAEHQQKETPCRLIPLTADGKTIDHFYRSGSQVELEAALAGWLRREIERLESDSQGAASRESASVAPGSSSRQAVRKYVGMHDVK